MASVLQEGMESKLAISGGFFHYGYHNNQALPQPHGGGQEEFSVCAEAHEEVFFFLVINIETDFVKFRSMSNLFLFLDLTGLISISPWYREKVI